MSSCVAVKVTVQEGRLDDFFKAIEVDARGSRDPVADPGCLRFDVLRSQQDPMSFLLYEIYEDAKAMEQHRSSAHFKAWTDFKASGGLDESKTQRLSLEASSIGDWALQKEGPGTTVTGLALLVTAEIKEDKIEDFLRMLEKEVAGNRDKTLDPGCLRFDLLRFQDAPNKFVAYEIYTDAEGLKSHMATDHFKPWLDFQSAGSVLNVEVLKLETTSIPGAWALQA